MPTTGLVQVYTGDGKGKTTASLGLALRAIGCNMKVHIIQFMKSGDTSEKYTIQKYLPHIKFIQFGRDALRDKQEKIYNFDPEKAEDNTLTDKERYIFLSDRLETEPSRRGLEYAKRVIMSGEYDIVILDEINCVIGRNIIPVQEILDLIKAKPQHVELILTGQQAPPELVEAADLVSYIQKIKHPYDKGILARKGIEY